MYLNPYSIILITYTTERPQTKHHRTVWDMQHYKQSPNNILNDQIHYKFHTIFGTIKHTSHHNISAFAKTMNLNIASSSTGAVKHWKCCTWRRKASAKNSSKLNKFLLNEVNLLIQHINFQILMGLELLNIQLTLVGNQPRLLIIPYMNVKCKINL